MRRAVAALALLAALAGGAARADEPVAVAEDAGPVHVHSPARCLTEGGTDLRLPAGYYLPEPAWAKLDADLKAAENGVTELTAENNRLRTLTVSRPVTTLVWIAAGALAGFVVGALAY
jgi:hypothetical protein